MMDEVYRRWRIPDTFLIDSSSYQNIKNHYIVNDNMLASGDSSTNIPANEVLIFVRLVRFMWRYKV